MESSLQKKFQWLGDWKCKLLTKKMCSVFFVEDKESFFWESSEYVCFSVKSCYKLLLKQKWCREKNMTLEVDIKVACFGQIAIIDSFCLTQMSNYIKKQITDANKKDVKSRLFWLTLWEPVLENHTYNGFILFLCFSLFFCRLSFWHSQIYICSVHIWQLLYRKI